MFHLSSGSAAEIVADAKDDGVDVTAETMPHYLQFNEPVMDRQGNAARVNPPIRTEEERQKLWEVGIEGDGIDCIATDHAPYTDEEKGIDDPFQNTWNVKSGFVGVETEVSAMYTLVDGGQLTVERWVDLHSRKPAQTWGLYPQKGSLQVGTDADFTILDPDADWTVDRHELRSKSRVTPYDGEVLTGKVTTTVVRGEVVFDDEVTGEPGYGSVVKVDR
jgi:dihydroorotase/allantoinase